jgi:hypothetical protein
MCVYIPCVQGHVPVCVGVYPRMHQCVPMCMACPLYACMSVPPCVCPCVYVGVSGKGVMVVQTSVFFNYLIFY